MSACIHWDLSDLFSSPQDPRIAAILDDSARRAAAFGLRYRGKINVPDLTAATLAEAIGELEALDQELAKPAAYTSLLFATATGDPEIGAFRQKIQEQTTQINLQLLFFSLELIQADEALIQRLITDEKLAPYRHFIESSRLYRPHQLSEPEERLLEELANTGQRAWARLFEQVTSNSLYTLTDGSGKTEKLTQSQILALIKHPDRETRRRAAEGFTAGLKENLPILRYIFNTLLQDKATRDRVRSYPSPERSRHLSNELEDQTVETVVQAVEKNTAMVSRYYDLKRRILKLDELTHYDRYAPLFDKQDKIPWEEARGIVLESFGACSPVLAQRAEEFFTRGWIDAEVRSGKRGGAFCSYITPDLHPYVLVNYLGKLDDVMTLAHELGHGVHASLSRGQSYFNFHGTLPLAELASTFGEMLVFEKLVQRASPQDRQALYADKIEGAFATIFRQAVMYRFEQDIHNHRRERGELSLEDFGGYWQNRQQSMFGSSVKLGEDHRNWWAYIPHFINSPFYVYAYSFGELLVMALFQQYKRKGEAFAREYLALLTKGGSESPRQLMAGVGIDLTDPAFWQGGLDVLGQMVGEFEALL